MEKHFVTGGIVTYNNEKIIKKCIRTILEYTKNIDFKLYVYDNCSCDGTVSVIEQNFPEVTVMRSRKNEGFGRGHNRIMAQVDSVYHVLINPDIVAETPVIEQMVSYMEKHQSIGILLPKVLNTDGTEQFLPKRQPDFKFVVMSKFAPFKYYRKLYTGETEIADRPVKCQNISGSFFIIKTEILKALGGFDERYFMYFEDADLAQRVINAGGSIVYHPDFCVYHEWKRDNTRSMRGICIFLCSMFKYMLKWKRF